MQYLEVVKLVKSKCLAKIVKKYIIWDIIF